MPSPYLGQKAQLWQKIKACYLEERSETMAECQKGREG